MAGRSLLTTSRRKRAGAQAAVAGDVDPAAPPQPASFPDGGGRHATRFCRVVAGAASLPASNQAAGAAAGRPAALE